MSLTDWIQAVSAAAVAVFTYFLWKLAHRQTSLLGESLRVARASAEAAQKSAETAERALIGVQRPLLKVALSQLQILPPKTQIDLPEYRTEITLTNIGKEPAIIAASAAQLVPCLRPLDPPQPGVRPFDAVWGLTELDEGILVPAGDHVAFEISRLMNEEEGEKLDNLQGARGRLFVYGVIVYDDLVGFRREFGFCFGWDGPEHTYFRCGLNGHNYDRIISPATNPIVFSQLETKEPG